MPEIVTDPGGSGMLRFYIGTCAFEKEVFKTKLCKLDDKRTKESKYYKVKSKQ